MKRLLIVGLVCAAAAGCLVQSRDGTVWTAPSAGQQRPVGADREPWATFAIVVGGAVATACSLTGKTLEELNAAPGVDYVIPDDYCPPDAGREPPPFRILFVSVGNHRT